MRVRRASSSQPSVCEVRRSMHSSQSELNETVCRKGSHAWEHAQHFCMAPLSQCQPHFSRERHLCHALSHNDRTFLFQPSAAMSASLFLTEVPPLTSISCIETLTQLLHSLTRRMSHAALFEFRSGTSCILWTRRNPLICFERLNVQLC